MSTSGVAVLDRTVQETNVWLRIVAEQLHFEDRQHAYIALRAVLHALRDRLPPEVAVLSFLCWCAASITRAGIWPESR
jgi:hypothetical protein